jgi:hypothetical protein
VTLNIENYRKLSIMTPEIIVIDKKKSIIERPTLKPPLSGFALLPWGCVDALWLLAVLGLKAR